jgi:hypothetical protein
MSVVVPRVFMSLGVQTVFLIGNSMVAPIMMGSFPVMEARQAYRTQWQPDFARAQIVILITNDTDVFRAIPDVAIGHTDIHRDSGWLHHYRRWHWWRDNDWRWRRRYDQHRRSCKGCQGRNANDTRCTCYFSCCFHSSIGRAWSVPPQRRALLGVKRSAASNFSESGKFFSAMCK